MLFGTKDQNYVLSESVLMNILGTRVQMGHVSVSLASKLISNGYAHLISFRPRSSKNALKNNRKLIDEDIAHICYQPDPVCAHLAMCLMDDTWKCHEIRGNHPEFWTEAATDLFSSGICHPSKGDVGEVAAALYLLFCGDILRRKINANYMNFSVDLSSYIMQLVVASSADDTEGKVPSNASSSTHQYKINFIQIVQQYFKISLEYLCSNNILEWMYNSACGVYLPSYSEVFDILAPIKSIDKVGNSEFVPFIISVKSRREFGPSEVQKEFKRMKVEMETNKVTNGLCLLVLLDVKNNPLTSEIEPNQKDLEKSLTTGIVYKAISIRNDMFGINKLVQNTRYAADNEKCQLYSCHAMLPHLSDEFWATTNTYTKNAWNYGQSVAKRKKVHGYGNGF
jgi:hypothetical protein